MKTKINKPLTLFFISIIAISFILGAIILPSYFNSKEWKQHTATGYIKEFTLYNTFPDNSLYIGFTDGKYILVTENRFWTYTQLINLNTSEPVDIIYKQNLNHKIVITQVNGYYYEESE